MRRSGDSFTKSPSDFEAATTMSVKNVDKLVVKSEKATGALYYDKHESNIADAQFKVITQELNRLYNPRNPQTYLVKDIDGYHVYSQIVDQYTSIAELIERDGMSAVIQKINSTEFQDIHTQILKCIITPASYIKKIVLINAADKDLGFIQLDEHIKLKLQLLKAACQLDQFRLFITSDKTATIVREYVSSMQNHFLNNGSMLDDNKDDINSKVMQEMQAVLKLASTSPDDENDWGQAYEVILTRNTSEIRDGRYNQLHLAITSQDKETLSAALLGHPELLTIKDRHLDTPLMLAARIGSFTAFIICEEHGANIKERDSEGNHVVAIAAKSGCHEIIDSLVSRHKFTADELNATNEKRQTALMLAAEQGHYDTVKCLLRHGGDPAAISADGISAIVLAARNGHSNIVVELLKNKQVRKDLSQIEPAFISAVHYSHFNTARIILSNINITDLIKNEICLKYMRVYAAETGDEQLFKELVTANNIDLNMQLDNTTTALGLLASSGDDNKLRMAVDYALAYNLGDEALYPADNLTLAHYAVDQNNIEVLNQLIKAGVNVNIRTKSGLTPFDIAVITEKTECIKALLNCGSAPDDAINRAFYHALDKQRAGLARLLLTYHPDVNYTPNIERNYTPLMLAAIMGDTELMQAICNETRFGSINHVANNGATALYKAIEYDNTDAATLILQHPHYRAGQDKDLLDKTLLSACSRNATAMVRALLTAHANINFVSEDGVTPLIIAAKTGANEVIDLLLQQPDFNSLNHVTNTSISAFIMAAECNEPEIALKLGCLPDTNVLQKDNHHHTGIYYLIQSGHFEICVAILLKHKLQDAHVIENSQTTLLHILASKGMTQEAKLLIESKANVNVATKDGDTPLMLAAINGHIEFMKLLLQNGAKSSLHQPDNKGITPLLAAVIIDKADAASLILASGKIDFTKLENRAAEAFHIALLDNHDFELCDAFIAAGFNVNNIIDSNFQNRCIHLAVERNDVDAVNYLLSKPILDLTTKNSHGKTAATLAVESKNHKLADRLVTNDRNRITGIKSTGTTKLYDHENHSPHEVAREKPIFIKGPPVPDENTNNTSQTSSATGKAPHATGIPPFKK